MTARFDDKGDLWLQVAGDIPSEMVNSGNVSAFATIAVVSPNLHQPVWEREINLTAYIRAMSRPSWVTQALAASTVAVQTSQTDAGS